MVCIFFGSTDSFGFISVFGLTDLTLTSEFVSFGFAVFVFNEFTVIMFTRLSQFFVNLSYLLITTQVRFRLISSSLYNNNLIINLSPDPNFFHALRHSSSSSFELLSVRRLKIPS